MSDDPSLDLKMLSGWPVAGVTYDPDYEDENGLCACRRPSNRAAKADESIRCFCSI